MNERSIKHALNYMEWETKDYLRDLKTIYPKEHQDREQFMRIVNALECFLQYGFWARHVQEETPE